MSVIAGCSLFKGVMLLADCRMTIRKPGQSDIYVDNVLKIFPIGPKTAIGFVGDIPLAGNILKQLFVQLRPSHRRRDAFSLLQWLPRYLRYSYAHYVTPRSYPVGFMVAAVFSERPNLIDRSKVVAIAERFRTGNLSAKRNWLPGIVVDILRMPQELKFATITDAPFGVLGFMNSPGFEWQPFYPLEFAAIGAGEQVVTQIDREADWIFAGDVGNSFVESMSLREAVSNFARTQHIESVGGLYPCLKVDADGIHALGYESHTLDGRSLRLDIDQNGRWVQRETNSERTLELQPPWVIDHRKYAQSDRFDQIRIF